MIYRLTTSYQLYITVLACSYSGEKVRISDEAERVQSVSYPHIQWRN